MRQDSLTGNRTKSCGCLRREVTGEAQATHKLSHTPEFRVWWSMIERCTNRKRKDLSGTADAG